MNASRFVRHRAARLVALAVGLGFVVGLVLGHAGLVPVPEVSVTWSIPALMPDGYLPNASTKEGDQLVLVYIGSSTCGWSNRPELSPMIRNLKSELSERAGAAGLGFAAVGVARDIRAADGLAHLEEFGPFDEVMAGNSWANTGIQEFVYGVGGMGGPGATPQVVLVSRRLDYSAGHVSLVDGRVLLRRSGFGEISDWVDAGAPFDIDGGHAGAAPDGVNPKERES